MLASLTPIPFELGPEPSSVEGSGFGVSLARFIDQSLLPMWIFDRETRQFLAVNAAALERYGWTRDEFLTMTVDAIHPASFRGTFAAHLGELRAGLDGVKATADSPHRTKSGASLRIETVWQSLIFQGRPAVHATMIDRTVQHDATEENQELAEVLNLAADAIIVLNLDREVLFWNQGAVKIYGWTAGEAVGKKVHEILKMETELAFKCMGGLLEKGEWQSELTHARKDGSTAIVNSRWSLAREELTGNPKCVLLISTDITERKSLERQFLRAQRLESLGTLASGIAHDLNNILSPILMATGILGQSKWGHDDRKMLAIIAGSAERGAGIVKQVLTFARGADGERVPLQTKHIVTEMIKVMAQTFPKNLNVQTSLPGDLWMVTGDATQIHQILLNLCVNARDAIGEKGGTIRITGENVNVDQQLASMNPGAHLGPHVCLSVGDTGAGMTPEVMERIFDPFFTTKEQGKGTGLGLATTVGIVKGHRGFITLQSQVKVGTTFRIFLPADVEAKSALPRTAEPEAAQGNGETLLIVDDEATIREAIVATLQANGYRCYTAEDGTDALALFFERRESISAVITDLRMGIMDGIELMRSLRRIAPETKVIVSSGHISSETREVLKTLNAQALLEKPYTADKLLRTVKEVIARSEGVVDLVG